MSLDQCHLHPPLEHPETNMSRAGIKPGPPASQTHRRALQQGAIRTAYAVTIRNLYNILVSLPKSLLGHSNRGVSSVTLTTKVGVYSPAEMLEPRPLSPDLFCLLGSGQQIRTVAYTNRKEDHKLNQLQTPSGHQLKQLFLPTTAFPLSQFF